MTEEAPVSIKADDFLPSLFHAADCDSLRAQRFYVVLIRVNLGLLAGIALLSLEVGGPAIAWRVSTVAAFVASAVITRVLLTRDFRERWYSGRAAAESIRTLGWRYAVHASPFQSHLSDADATELFVQRSKDVLSAIEASGIVITPDVEQSGGITEAMVRLRAASFEERKRAYVSDRLGVQHKWYGGKAKANEKCAAVFSWLVVGLEALAALVALFLVTELQVSIGWVGVVATLGAVGLSWFEFRRYDELHHAYSIAAHELALAISLAPNVDESRFTAFVDDAEAAISREHTLWVARRQARIKLS